MLSENQDEAHDEALWLEQSAKEILAKFKGREVQLVMNLWQIIRNAEACAYRWMERANAE